MPMEVLQTSFWRLDPARTVGKFERLGRGAPAGRRAARLRRAGGLGERRPAADARRRPRAARSTCSAATDRARRVAGGGRAGRPARTSPARRSTSSRRPTGSCRRPARRGIGTGLSLGLGHVGMIVGGRARAAAVGAAGRMASVTSCVESGGTWLTSRRCRRAAETGDMDHDRRRHHRRQAHAGRQLPRRLRGHARARARPRRDRGRAARRPASLPARCRRGDPRPGAHRRAGPEPGAAGGDEGRHPAGIDRDGASTRCAARGCARWRWRCRRSRPAMPTIVVAGGQESMSTVAARAGAARAAPRWARSA